MTHSSRSLDNPIDWSFPVGRLFGVTIRLHLLFVLCALWMVFDTLRPANEGLYTSATHALLHGLGRAALLFAIVLLHEFGHCFGARYSGGSADEILLWPLGGLATVNPPHTPWANAVTVAAGPLVNVVFCAASALILVIWVGTLAAVPWNPWYPFSPVRAYLSEGQSWLAMFFGLNYVVLLFNLLPVFPLDGGRLVQCLLWSRRGYRDATMAACGTGMVGAILMGLVGLLTENYLLAGVAFFGYLTCYQQRRAMKLGAFEGEPSFGDDFAGGFHTVRTAAARPKRPSWWARKRAARAEARERQERARLAELQRRVDAILDKVHQHGIHRLTDEERRILNEATDRQRTEDERLRRG